MWDSLLTPDVLFFFDGQPGALALYEELARQLLSEYPETRIQVKKTQIGFHGKPPAMLVRGD